MPADLPDAIPDVVLVSSLDPVLLSTIEVDDIGFTDGDVDLEGILGLENSEPLVFFLGHEASALDRFFLENGE